VTHLVAFGPDSCKHNSHFALCSVWCSSNHLKDTTGGRKLETCISYYRLMDC